MKEQKPSPDAEKQSKQTKLPYTIDRIFSGIRTAEEVVADLIKAHMV